jgi:predicted RNA-binding protein YlqC (UPF0109 family)
MMRIDSGTRYLERGRAMMRDLVTTIVKAIVDYPNAVEVKEVEGERTTVVELRVAKEDVGKVIGKQGRIAEAIRVILGAAGAKIKRKIELEILEW